MLTRETFIGPWAGLPVAWTDADEFDEATYRADIVRCCEAGAPGVYTGGTTGEFYAIEIDEFERIAQATVETCHECGKPAMIGCTATSTRGAIRRATLAAEIGADAVQVALPFWLELHDDEVVQFFGNLAEAIPEIPLSIYETRRAKKCLTIEQHRQIREVARQYLMVKANAGTIGDTPEGCRQLSEFVNVFVGEPRWSELGPHGAVGCCSAMIYWSPQVLLAAWHHMHRHDWLALHTAMEPINRLYDFLHTTYGPRGFSDSAYDRMGGLATRFLSTSLHNRGPYHSATTQDVDTLRQWIEANFPEMMAVAAPLSSRRER